MANTFNLNQFTITNGAGFLDNPSNFNTMTIRIDPASTKTFYPGTAVKLTATGTAEKATATDSIVGIIYYNEVYNTHTAINNFMVSIALDGDQMTLLAGSTINAGDLLEFSPQVSGQDKAVPKTTGIVIAKALQPANIDEPVLVQLLINQ